MILGRLRDIAFGLVATVVFAVASALIAYSILGYYLGDGAFVFGSWAFAVLGIWLFVVPGRKLGLSYGHWVKTWVLIALSSLVAMHCTIAVQGRWEQETVLVNQFIAIFTVVYVFLVRKAPLPQPFAWFDRE